MLLERLSYLDQQRAEYLADALAARVAGMGAMVSLLRRTSLADLGERELMGLSGQFRRDGTELFSHLAEPLRRMDTPEARAALARMEAELIAVDGSHPPSRFRIGFVEAVGPSEPAIRLDRAEAAAIDQEMAPHAGRVADRFYDSFERQ